eukprot:TRINITY_DN4213_c0_g2_i1.p1 TRINITY_DN4213_c0_g2~~TRINITY_DN4213_c0_g2_i1.p1  ORF type:complete len:476 (+),score=88.16 TRINITY_DN4213_c0_g2_i1:76-1428(+)
MPGGQIQRLLDGAKFPSVAPMTGDPLLAERTELEVFTQLLNNIQGCLEAFGSQAAAAGAAHRGLSELLAGHMAGEGRGSDAGAHAIRQMSNALHFMQQRLSKGQQAIEHLAQMCATAASRNRHIHERFEGRDRAWSVCQHYESKVQQLQQISMGDPKQAERLARNREKLRRSEEQLSTSVEGVRRVIGEALNDKQATLCNALASLCGCYSFSLGDLGEPLQNLNIAKQLLDNAASAPSPKGHQPPLPPSPPRMQVSHTHSSVGAFGHENSLPTPSNRQRPRPLLDGAAMGHSQSMRSPQSPSGIRRTPSSGNRGGPGTPTSMLKRRTASGSIVGGSQIALEKPLPTMDELFKLPLRDLRTMLAGTGVAAPLGMTDKADLVAFVHRTLHAGPGGPAGPETPTSPHSPQGDVKRSTSATLEGGKEFNPERAENARDMASMASSGGGGYGGKF